LPAIVMTPICRSNHPSALPGLIPGPQPALNCAGTNYRSLRPGLWVVFSGTSSSKQDANRRAARAKSLGYRDAYPRFISG